MVITVTVNPSLDYFVSMKQFRLGATNRTTSELLLPGGKGINVSTVLTTLGIPNTAVFFSAGFVGEEITRLLSVSGIRTMPIRVAEGCSRLNLKLRTEEDVVEGTELNGMGPQIPDDKLEEMMRYLSGLAEGDTLVLGGTVPGTLPATIYRDILERVKDRKLKVVVDATKDLLLDTLSYHPFLIKPNHHELGELFGSNPDPETEEGREEIISLMHKLREMGARNVLCSMSRAGAILLTEEGNIYAEKAPDGHVISAVGSGDSMVAGFLAGWQEKEDPLYALRLGVAAGSASAFSERLAGKDAILELVSKMY